MASTSEERWQAKGNTVLERNKFMFNNPVMSDIKFAFPDKQTISAHKYVLAISSQVFFAMFYGDLAEKREAIDITDCDPDIFLQFLRYIYCDDANFRDVACAIQVWYLADKYDVPSLAGECVEFLDRAMDPLEALDVIQHAIHLKDHGLEKSCWEVIDYNAQEIVAEDSFLELNREFLLLFFERSSLRIDEATLFKAVDRWAARKCEEADITVDGANKRCVLGEDILKNVRFSLMSPEQFSNVVLPKEILSTTEVIDVFKQFTAVSIPGGLKFSILPRMTDDVPLHLCSMGQPYASYVDESSSYPKTGVLTFMVSEYIALCGVKIITEGYDTGNRRLPSRAHLVNLSVTRRGKKIRQIKDKSFINTGGKTHIDVFFNRPFSLSLKTCYTIETETDLTREGIPYVFSDPRRKSKFSADKLEVNIVSGHCSGLYTECIPTNVCYRGEIMALFFKKCNNN